MLFYVKDRKTFTTKAVLEGVSWKLVRSVWTDLSEITAKDDPNVAAGDFVYNLDGWIGLVSDLERDGNQISLKLEKIERLLSRKVQWPGYGQNQYAEFCMAFLLNNYYIPGAFEASNRINDSDYAISFLEADRQTLSAVGAYPVLSDGGTVSGMSYISQIRRNKSVFCTFSITSTNTLKVTIEQKTQTQKTLITTNYPCVVKEESFSETKVAKVTTYVNNGGYPPSYDNTTHWYLFTDGSIGNDPTAGTREEGEWVSIALNDYDDAEVVARNEFGKNSYSHKLVIQMQEKDARYDFYDLVRVEVGNHIYDSYVSRKTITSDGLVEYTFGDLKTSLMDKINEYD